MSYYHNSCVISILLKHCKNYSVEIVKVVPGPGLGSHCFFDQNMDGTGLHFSDRDRDGTGRDGTGPQTVGTTHVSIQSVH